MKKIAFIPTRSLDDSAKTSHYLLQAGWDVNPLVGKTSIFGAYDEAVREHDIQKDDQVIFCHDDIDILTRKKTFNDLIDINLRRSDVGFIGVAGTRMYNQTGVWWDGLRDPQKKELLSGHVFHGKDLMGMYETYYGHPGEVVVLDGLFLAARGSTLAQIQLKKPKKFSGDWDFYDIFYTFQAFRKGLKNITVPIQILHESIGELAGRDSWHKNRVSFLEMFAKDIPAKSF